MCIYNVVEGETELEKRKRKRERERDHYTPVPGRVASVGARFLGFSRRVATSRLKVGKRGGNQVA